MQLHNRGRADHSPMEMVSAELLAHLLRCEAELLELTATGTIDQNKCLACHDLIMPR